MLDPRYPNGKYEPKEYSEAEKVERLAAIKALPSLVAEAVEGLSEEQQNTPYREGGWTVKQVVHHIADSHINAYTRFKLGLTELNPVIKPYFEKEWANLPDVHSEPIEISIQLLTALHQRWYSTIKDLDETHWQRTLVHPEHGTKWTLWFLLGLYAWHGKHHVAHINTLRKNNNW